MEAADGTALHHQYINEIGSVQLYQYIVWELPTVQRYTINALMNCHNPFDRSYGSADGTARDNMIRNGSMPGILC